MTAIEINRKTWWKTEQGWIIFQNNGDGTVTVKITKTSWNWLPFSRATEVTEATTLCSHETQALVGELTCGSV